MVVAKKRLANGYEIPSIIKGGWQLAGGHGPVDMDQACADMEAFVRAGVTAFDCADIYTGVEELIGQFLRSRAPLFNSGELPRPMIHTKYVPDLEALATLNRQYTEAVIDRSLRRLGVEVLDLVQFHWWDLGVPRYVEVAHHLLDLQKSGKIRHIGVTNFGSQPLREMLESGVPILTAQVQYSVFDQRPRHDLDALCKAYDIGLLCYGTVAGGLISDRFLDAPEITEPHENRSQTKYKLIVDECGGWEYLQKMLRLLKIIGDAHNTSLANVAIAYVLQQKNVLAAIVGARSARHLTSLQEIDRVQLSLQEVGQIEALIANAQGPQGMVYELERDKSGRHGRIMKYNLNATLPEAAYSHGQR